ncbi:MAG: GNAT family N-acetyltransferase [Vulcanimicrobiaceae bacterium]
MRGIVPSDAASYRSILERTSAEDRYCRFFCVVNELRDDFIEPYVAQRPDSIGLIAEEAGRPLGAAHAFFEDSERAEMAIVVAADARRRGVGRSLIDRLVLSLQDRGCKSAIAYALRDNLPFANLGRSVGMRAERFDGGVVMWSLDATKRDFHVKP